MHVRRAPLGPVVLEGEISLQSLRKYFQSVKTKWRLIPYPAMIPIKAFIESHKMVFSRVLSSHSFEVIEAPVIIDSMIWHNDNFGLNLTLKSQLMLQSKISVVIIDDLLCWCL